MKSVSEMSRQEIEALGKQMVKRIDELSQVGRWMSDELRTKTLDAIQTRNEEYFDGCWSDQDYTGFKVGTNQFTDDELLSEVQALCDYEDDEEPNYGDELVNLINELEAEKGMHEMLKGKD